MRARYIVIPVVILVTLAATSFWVYRTTHRQPEYELFEVHRGSVTRSVAISGSVVSRERLELGFLSPGIVKSVAVGVGDQVKAGDLLVVLDTVVLQNQAAQARANAAAAQAMLRKAQDGLRSVDRGVLDRSLSSAGVALNTAQANLQDAYRARDIEAENARVALDNARSAYNYALSMFNSSQGAISGSAEIARVALSNALLTLNYAQSNYNSIYNLYQAGQATVYELQQAQLTLNNANAGYQSARASYDAAIRQSTVEQAGASSNLDAARSRLDSAQAAYNVAVVGADIKVRSAQNGLSAAQAAYDLTQAQYNQASAPAHSADIDVASAQAAAAYAAARSIEAQITRAKLTAPIAGVITDVNAKVGELSPMTSAAVVLETTGDFLIEANISEVDVNDIKISQSVRITFDAISDTKLNGTVASIDPAATVVLGVINYKVTVAFNEMRADIRPAMTADLEILTDQREDVIFLPRRVLKRTETGIGYFVQVLTSEGIEDRDITIGLMGDNEVEVTAGLNEGEQVVLREV
ncbi:hypothetical protein A2V68_01770 [candidate division Kazan bacterium RBG_13_50_9]|uniref:Uncharacterized protein n=1 Tax=candidate division Kazan bacterium RBG_13_50_9 TaxID=1798535 RepID=A0A1F4NSZ6_UNCK3|nr:MAG: hypothetical protein A2V68_01770 [candidate division Kazan bacterium RBG_13_50_9]